MKGQPVAHIHRSILLLAVLLMVLCQLSDIKLVAASSKDTSLFHLAPLSSCQQEEPPTRESLLVVMLDRSGSIAQTDPGDYEASVTNALADLWPGPIAVVIFNGDSPSVSVYGPASTDVVARAMLKNEVESSPISGNTPLNLAMRKALDLLRGAAPGSRAILITDGQPTGTGKEDTPSQEQDIRQNLIPQFCHLGITVNAFGLAIDTSTSEGADADRLLTDINAGTGAGATYNHVESPEGLASSIVGLYAHWLDLNFSPITKDQNGAYPFSVDSFAQRISIIVLRASKNHKMLLIGPDGQPLQGVQTSTPVDKHYEIDNLNVTPPVIAGSYKVDAGNDSDTQVYALIKSTLKLEILSPSRTAIGSINQSIEIKAALYDGQNQLTTTQNEAQVRAYVTLYVNGKPIGATAEIDLKQQRNVFVNQTSVYTQAGILRIDVKATYKEANREVLITIPLQQPLLPSPAPSNPFKEGGPILLVLGGLIFVLLLVSLNKGRRRGRKGSVGYN